MRHVEIGVFARIHTTPQFSGSLFAVSEMGVATTANAERFEWVQSEMR